MPDDRQAGRIVFILAIALVIVLVLAEVGALILIAKSTAPAEDKAAVLVEEVNKIINAMLAGILGWLIGRHTNGGGEA